ncbi:MAG: zeta toxin family protein [Pseudomonadota bacterium]|nr:zeta toxin family protein [Pseudomonadota bacterium]
MSTRGDLMVVLAPVGAGKSTRINQLRAQGMTFQHISCDHLIDRAAKSQGIDLNRASGEVARHVVGEGMQAYYARLDESLRDKGEKIVVDYASGLSTDWVTETVRRAHIAGRDVTVEGIYVDPERSLPRTLVRKTVGMDAEAVKVLLADNRYIQAWLKTYQAFPQQFEDAVAMAGTGRLFDNNEEPRPTQRLIAEWREASRRATSVYDAEAYGSFLSLSGMDLPNAKCAVTLRWSQAQGDDWMHGFAVNMNDAIRPGRKTAPAVSFARPEVAY